MGRNKKERIGEISYNKNNNKMIIIKYENCHNVTVQFEDGYITTVEYIPFKKGEVKNPYEKSVYKHGYVGEGSYKPTNKNKNTIQYQRWLNMLQRCYDNKFQIEYPTYIGCTVCEEWLNFQTFAKWFDENYYEIDNEKMCLDKDILHKGNKIYSPETCIIVPNFINTLFIKSDAIRGKYPIGIYLDKNKYKVQCSYKGKIKNLGRYEITNYNKAFMVYKRYKERLIKQIADEYKNKISQKLYDAMYKYEVEITD